MPEASENIRVGISSCLLGEKVRYDGGHKWNGVVNEILAKQVTWVPVCPEVESGMGVPREPLILEEDDHVTRLIGVESGKDWTTEMVEFARQKIPALKNIGLDGFILKKNSPSCGLRRVTIYADRDLSVEKGEGAGLFANQLLDSFPGLPIVDEDDLRGKKNALKFLEAVKRYNRARLLDK